MEKTKLLLFWHLVKRRGPPLLCDKLCVLLKCLSVPVLLTRLPFCLPVLLFGTPCLPLLPRVFPYSSFASIDLHFDFSKVSFGLSR